MTDKATKSCSATPLLSCFPAQVLSSVFKGSIHTTISMALLHHCSACSRPGHIPLNCWSKPSFPGLFVLFWWCTFSWTVWLSKVLPYAFFVFIYFLVFPRIRVGARRVFLIHNSFPSFRTSSAVGPLSLIPPHPSSTFLFFPSRFRASVFSVWILEASAHPSSEIWCYWEGTTLGWAGPLAKSPKPRE